MAAGELGFMTSAAITHAARLGAELVSANRLSLATRLRAVQSRTWGAIRFSTHRQAASLIVGRRKGGSAGRADFNVGAARFVQWPFDEVTYRPSGARRIGRHWGVRNEGEQRTRNRRRGG